MLQRGDKAPRTTDVERIEFFKFPSGEINFEIVDDSI
jgi:hypothetical protein